jgi:hypothetical protein
MPKRTTERIIAGANETVRRLNPHVFGHDPKAEVRVYRKDPVTQERTEVTAPAQGKRIRQDSKPLMNKLEAEFFNYLKALHAGANIRVQALRFRLGNGIWYKPDFVTQETSFTVSHQPLKVVKQVAYEVKGPHAFRGGFENLKVAAAQWPEVRWVLVWKEQGQWKQQEVLP